MTEVETKSPASPVVDPPSAPERSNDTNNQEPETSQFPPQGPSGQPFPPPNFGFYNYPPGHQSPPGPGEGGNSDPNAQPNGNGPGPGSGPYPPPGMMYPFAYSQQPPPPGYMPVQMSGMPLPGALVKPKRKQVKMACTNCAAACKRCDVSRPCERCIKYGLADTCRDGQRKERKKGFKRGPYNKRKRQEEREAQEWEAAHNNPNGEWTPGGPSGPPFPGPPQQGPFPPPPEGYYPAFYALAPPPPGPGPQLVPVQQAGAPNDQPVEGQPEGNPDPNHNGDQSQGGPQGQPSFPPPHAQFVYPSLAPGSYPPYGYPFPAPPPQQHQHQQQEAASTNPKKRHSPDDVVDAKDEDDEDPPTPPRKRRGRRNSDGEWPGASKRTAKSKVENPAPTRRSTRKQRTSDADQAGASDGHGDGSAVSEGGVQAADQNAAPQPTEEPVAQIEPV